ncbi:hypothetical protein [uncultured Nocardioides sp.]|uniref:hypothetical protein n=1 Tax=uncultured Nocardioides sp. TaxID=198441 RepID=UPI00262437EE|nr:hypothetical protein [uncultured Nocardioides sp.]
MKTWDLAHGRDGWNITTYEVPAWRVVVERVGEWSTHHVFGGIVCCRIPGWAYQIPLGRPKRDEDGWLDNSFGYWLFCAGSRLHGLGRAWQHRTNVVSHPVTVEQAGSVDQEFVSWIEDELGDDEVSAP